MNINDIMEEIIEFRLGLDMLHLEDYHEKIKRLLEKKTLTTFSQYVPYTLEDSFNVSPTKNPNAPSLYDGYENTDDGFTRYYISHPLVDNNKMDILGIAKITAGGSALNGINATASPIFDLEGMLEHSLRSSIQSKMGFKYRRWDFDPPNIIKLRGYGECDIVIKLKLSYPSFSSIPMGFQELFYKLAVLDVKIFLYNKLKYINNLETPLGSIDLMISDWEGAEEERSDFLEELEAERLTQGLIAAGRFEFRN